MGVAQDYSVTHMRTDPEKIYREALVRDPAKHP